MHLKRPDSTPQEYPANESRSQTPTGSESAPSRLNLVCADDHWANPPRRPRTYSVSMDAAAEQSADASDTELTTASEYFIG
ncbi:MAG: hypothetical protein ACP5O1_07405 [Phycisphaerae bacterium]